MAKRGTSRREFWISHLNKWRAQGGTMKAYARANDLVVGNFYTAKSAYGGDLPSGKHMDTVGRAKVTLLPVHRAPVSDLIRVSLPNGVRIEVPGIIDGEQWRALLDSLGHRG